MRVFKGVIVDFSWSDVTYIHVVFPRWLVVNLPGFSLTDSLFP